MTADELQRVTIINIEGESGSGKTTLLSQLYRELSSKYEVILYRDTSIPSDTKTQLAFMRGIYTVLSQMKSRGRVFILTERLFSDAYLRPDDVKGMYVKEMASHLRNVITVVLPGDSFDLYNILPGCINYSGDTFSLLSDLMQRVNEDRRSESL